jgi:methionine-rich copper-binding protein CopC
LTIINNSITGNTAPNGAAIYNNATIIDLNNTGTNTVANGGTVTATPNWWGSNAGPAPGDVAGNETVTITPWLETPTVINVDPANGAVNVPVNQVITITFSEPIQAGSNYNLIKILKPEGTSKLITTSISSDTLTITPLTYNFNQGTTYNIYIPANAVQNSAGQGLTTTYTSTFTTGLPPTVTSVNPANAAVNVPVNQVITITFSGPIQAGIAYNGIEVLKPNGAPKSVTTSISGDTLTITPLTYNYNADTTYTIYIPAYAIEDQYGNPITTTYTSTFTTGTPPTVTSVNPANGAVNVPVNQTITITFNGPIQAGSAYNSIEVLKPNGAPKLVTISISGDTLTITPLTYNYNAYTTYTIYIPVNAIDDQYGNPITTTYTSSFTTAS